MSITSGYTKYKRYQKLSDGTYQLVSQWTSSNTVHFDDGATAEAKIATMQTAIDGVNTKVNNLSELSAKQVEVLNERMNTFTALEDGSTTGDAELIDARIDKDGNIHENVGEHIRNIASQLSSDIAKLSGYNNELVFPNKIFNTDGILAESIENTSLINLKADEVTLSSQKVFNVLADEPFYLRPNTTYTMSTERVSGEYVSGGANNLKICRRDTYGQLALINSFTSSSKKFITFTTPSDCEEYYFVLTFASSSNLYNFDIDININISEGETPNYLQYGIDVNKGLPTIEKLLIDSRATYDILVSLDGDGDYTTLTEAVENAKDFDVIYVKNGVYENEIVKAWLKTVFIIGESREGVIIKNNTGAYATPPVEMGTGLLRNLTIYAENDGTLETEPSNKGYALHSESSVTNCDNFVIENCTLKSDWRQSWGMGMRGGMTYVIRNSEYDGVYFHDCEHVHAVGEQNIFFDNCNIVKKSLIMQDQNMDGSSIDVRFNRCLIEKEIIYYSWDSEHTTTITKTGLEDFPNWSLNSLSWGNSKEELNAI